MDPNSSPRDPVKHFGTICVFHALSLGQIVAQRPSEAQE